MFACCNTGERDHVEAVTVAGPEVDLLKEKEEIDLPKEKQEEGQSRSFPDAEEEWETFTSWECRVEKATGKALGLDVAEWGQCLRVLAIEPSSPLWQHNANASVAGQRQIRPDDIITQVNGQTGPEEMSVVLRNNNVGDLDLHVTHTKRCVIQIPRTGEGLGINIRYVELQDSVKVMGLVPEKAADLYNKGASPDKQLLTGDLIVSVNGTFGTSTQLSQAMKDGTVQVTELLVIRIVETSAAA